MAILNKLSCLFVAIDIKKKKGVCFDMSETFTQEDEQFLNDLMVGMYKKNGSPLSKTIRPVTEDGELLVMVIRVPSKLIETLIEDGFCLFSEKDILIKSIFDNSVVLLKGGNVIDHVFVKSMSDLRPIIQSLLN